MNFFDQNSAPAISGNLANYAFRTHALEMAEMRTLTVELENDGSTVKLLR